MGFPRLQAREDVNLAQYTADTASVPDAASEIVRADFVEAFTHHRSGAVTEFRHTAEDWGIRFEGIESTVCFWHGTADANVPIEGVRHLEARIPSARLEVLDDADHLQTLIRCIPNVLDAYE